MTLVAGYTLGTIFSRIFPLEFVTVREGIETVHDRQRRDEEGVVNVGTYADFGLEGLMPRRLRSDC